MTVACPVSGDSLPWAESLGTVARDTMGARCDDMGLFKAPETVRQLLAQCYAYLVRAAAARSEGVPRYATAHHMLARAFYRDLLAGVKRIGSFYGDEREKLGSVQCAYCGRSGRLSLDHLVPRLVGGPDDANNLIPACRSCNSSKGAHDVMAWHVRKGRYPRRAVLRRYVKLAWRWCERDGQLDRRLDDADDMPFDFARAGSGRHDQRCRGG